MSHRRYFAQGGLPQRLRLIGRQQFNATNKPPPRGNGIAFEIGGASTVAVPGSFRYLFSSTKISATCAVICSLTCSSLTSALQPALRSRA
jgi:hypothetical protein